jgi:spermidine/putrescine transport system ATP-binding protein
MSDNVVSESARDADSTGENGAVRIRNVTKEFDDVTAVDDVSFDIREREFFTLLGPSGSGKSTLLQILAGLLDATSGEVTINGRDMARVPPEKRPTNMIFQQLALFPHKSVYENLEFGLKMQGVPKAERRERADDMLDTLGLAGHGEKAIGELSGGEQQRIALGRSLLANPEILLLDEPLSSLDRKLKEEMQLELRRIHSELDSTFLYVTHDQDVALTASDRIAVIDDGELVQVGAPRELYEEPASRFVAEFIGDTNYFVGEVVSVDDDAVRIETSEGLRLVTADRTEAAPGSRFELSLRPEEVTMGEDASGLDNQFEGTVAERIYRGDRTRYVVSVDGVELLVQRPRRSSERVFSTDESVAVGWEKTAGYPTEVS